MRCCQYHSNCDSLISLDLCSLFRGARGLVDVGTYIPWKGPLNVLILVHICVSVVPRGSHLGFRPTYGLHSDLTGIPLRLLDPKLEEVLQNLESGESDQCFLELVYSSP